MSTIFKQYNQTLPPSKVLIASYPQKIANYWSAVADAGFSPLSPFDDNNSPSFPILSELSALSFDLLLLPGGGDISPRLYHQENTGSHFPDYELDLVQFQLLQLAVMRKKPVLGICKGMQLINVFFGGTLCQHLPTRDMHSTPGKDCFHKILFSPSFPYQSNIPIHKFYKEKLYDLLLKYPLVNSAHHQGISCLGKNLFCIQYSEDYLPETILHSHLPILGFQWHPERLPAFSSQSFSQLLDLLLNFERL